MRAREPSRPGMRRRLSLGTLAALSASAVAHAVPAPEDAARDASCCSVIELRQYTLHPGRREGFIALFDGSFASPLDATGMTVIGQFRDLDRPERFVWMRGFQDMTARARELAAFYDGALWHARREEANSAMLDSDNVLLLEPAAPGLGFAAPPERRTSSAATAPGLIVVTLYYTRADSLAAFGSLFERSLRARQEALGARTLGAYVTSTQANNFPRLPIRSGESIYLWVARFADADAQAGWLARLQADARWREQLWPAARRYLSHDPEVLRLAPTARSRLQ
jgi:hypothetical protein